LAQGGDDRAFNELVLRRQGWVRALLRRLSGDRDLADDLAQQAFLQAWRSLPSLRAPGAFGAWLRRIVVHVWLQEARRVRLVSGGDFEIATDTFADPAHPPDRPGDRLDLERALLRLNGAERLCVVLSYAEGLSHVARGGSKLKAWLGIEAGDD
jgi:RNA polymerase sigma-70 factor (ECF subfamily)